ncbi:hypothetical protein DSO57_1022533 [Entomophthora muscae]|uniref:Uncharacterized protein n=1 Tax=Entomophthora muscae TaxID=34485 RepID=A0ACC2RU99_9FUNG|nr:hypothetical protein DSO57_1022533 [Entomophthora muscae]
MKTKALELTPSDSRHAPLPVFQVGDMVLYYQHQVGGRAHKSDSLWIGPLEVLLKRGAEYTVKLLSTERPFARVHAKFLNKYTPKANLEGGNVGNPDTHALWIWSLLAPHLWCKILQLLWGFRLPVPKCVLGHSQGLAWRSCHSPEVVGGLLEACT